MTEYVSVTEEIKARAERGETISAQDAGSEFVDAVYCNETKLDDVVAFNAADGWADVLRTDRTTAESVEIPSERVYGRITFTFAPNAPR